MLFVAVDLMFDTTTAWLVNVQTFNVMLMYLILSNLMNISVGFVTF